jgi:beta-carotene hydroxylase
MVGAVQGANLRRQEIAIAARFLGGFPWPMAAWALFNTSVWLALWPLVLGGYLPLWAGTLIAAVTMILAYLPSHEAQHDIFFPRHSPHHWLNEAIGYYALIPLATPLRLLRITHLEHHRHAGDPARDPDMYLEAPHALAAVGRGISKSQPRNDRYGATLRRLGTPAALAALREGIWVRAAFFGALSALAWSGFALEAALLWWLPRHIGFAYINFFLGWAPHFPNQRTGRYRDTRAFKSRVGNIGSLGMQYHIVHHLYPTIPLHKF